MLYKLLAEEKYINFSEIGVCSCNNKMEAITYLGFAMQAADISTRTAIGLKQGYQRACSHRDDRLAEYVDTIQEYHFTIENLYSGGGSLSADAKHPLGTCLAKMTASLSSMRMLGGLYDIENQTSTTDQHLLEKLTNDLIWSEFQRLKAELLRLEKGLQHFTTSYLLQSMYVLPRKLFKTSN